MDRTIRFSRDGSKLLYVVAVVNTTINARGSAAVNGKYETYWQGVMEAFNADPSMAPFGAGFQIAETWIALELEQTLIQTAVSMTASGLLPCQHVIFFLSLPVILRHFCLTNRCCADIWDDSQYMSGVCGHRPEFAQLFRILSGGSLVQAAASF